MRVLARDRPPALNEADAWMPSFEDARRFLAATFRAGDLYLGMGAGDIDSLSRSLVS